MKKLLLGNAAIAQGAYEAGVKFVSSYPGTPSTEITECMATYPADEVFVEWAPNEKVAAEAVVGAAIAGGRAMSCCKHVGLNVMADAIFTDSYIGVNGGAVFCVADDPGMHSSQNEQDSRHYARASKITMLEPADSSECLEFTKLAFDISEQFDTPVFVRLSTRVSHSQSLVEVGQRNERAVKPYEKNIPKHVMMPAMARGRHVLVEERTKKLSEYAETSPLNVREDNGAKIGVITAGIAYEYAKEALGDKVNYLKLGMVWPLPANLLRDFAASCEKVYVVEELDPFIENECRALGIDVVGKELFTMLGEYTPSMIRSAVLGDGECDCVKVEENIPNRPPVLCSGCPHRATFYVLKKLGLTVSGDIGCYTLGAVAPLASVDTTICMGSSISLLHGMEMAKGKEFIKNWVATIGDSTFLHTGINSLINMVYNKATGTVMILDNRTTGMTGHQEHAATGKTLKGEDTYAIDLATLCRSVGVPNVIEIDAFDVIGLEKVIKESVNGDILTVIIAKAPCALLKGQKFPFRCEADPEKCKKCGMCLKIGCPALTKNADGTVKINETMCNGCGLCMSYCKFGAISKVER